LSLLLRGGSRRDEMSRTPKFYSRLAALEREYRSLVRDEFILEAERGCSRFLSDYFRSLTAPDDPATHVRCDRLTHMAREIQTLRCKLGEKVPGPVQAIVDRFMDESVQFRTRGADRVALAKQAVKQLDALDLAEVRR